MRRPTPSCAGMMENIEFAVPAILSFASVIYLWLAVKVSRASSESANTAISFVLFLIGLMTAGSAFSFNTTDPNIYGIGRTLTYFSSGFIPIALFAIYRELTAGKVHGYVLALLSIIPIISTALAMTNALHEFAWSIVVVDGDVRFTQPDEHFWFSRVHAPYAIGLFGISLLALASQLPGTARAHRHKVVLLIVAAVVPFAVSFANVLLGIGSIDFPLTSATLVVLLPLYWWTSLSLRVHGFSPLAYQTMFNHVRDPIIVLDTSQRIISANNPAQQLLNGSENDLIGQKLWDDIPEAQAILDHSKDRDLTQTLRMKSDRYYELSSAPLTGPSGRKQGTVVVCRDVTERKHALRALADSEHLIRTLVEHSSSGILRFSIADDGDGQFRCSFANRAAESFLQDSSGALVGTPLDKLEILDPEGLRSRFGADSKSRKSLSFEKAVETEEGETWLRISAEPVGKDFSVTLIDITQRKRNETRILADALRDPLTGVMNRRGFEQQGGDAIVSHDEGAVLYLDLNHFKSINDRFGHQAGDALLKAFGHRLEFCLRPEDVLARLGGDEFAIILPGVSVEEAKHVAQRLIETAFEAYIIQGQEIECTASVGIAFFPAHGSDLWHLVSVADQAMYSSKQISKEDAANDKAAYIDASVAS